MMIFKTTVLHIAQPRRNMIIVLQREKLQHPGHAVGPRVSLSSSPKRFLCRDVISSSS